MKAPQFHLSLASGIASTKLPENWRQLKGKNAKWRAITSVGTVVFSFMTNVKVSTLDDIWPGEFRVDVQWKHPNSVVPQGDFVSLFQYIETGDLMGLEMLQKSAVSKFLQQRFSEEALREEWIFHFKPFDLPSVQFDSWMYYFDEHDAFAYGQWFGALMPIWLARFDEFPEQKNTYVSRVFWSGKK